MNSILVFDCNGRHKVWLDYDNGVTSVKSFDRTRNIRFGYEVRELPPYYDFYINALGREYVFTYRLSIHRDQARQGFMKDLERAKKLPKPLVVVGKKNKCVPSFGIRRYEVVKKMFMCKVYLRLVYDTRQYVIEMASAEDAELEGQKILELASHAEGELSD